MSHHTGVAELDHHHPPATPGHHDHQQPETHQRKPWTILGLMLAAQFMVILDVSVVNVALPSIGEALAFTSSDYQWTVSAYVLLSGGLLLLGGRLADLFDRRRMFLTGLGLFTAASMASGFAIAPLMMTLSRAAQGAGAAMLTPAALSIVMTTYVGKQRTTALAVWGTIGSMGIAAGVLFGGILTTALGWQAIFFINVPIGVAVAALTARTVSHGGQRGSFRQLDIPGAVTAVGGLLALVYAIEHTSSHGWTATTTLLAFTAAAILLGSFVVIETRVEAPLVPPSTWRMRSLVSASTVMAVITGAVVGAIFLSSLFLQGVLGSSAIVTGLQFLPLAFFITLAAAGASKLLPHLGAKVLMVAGLVVVAGGAAFLANVDQHPSYWSDVLPGLVIIGLGVGPMFVAISVAAMAGIPHEKSGLASGLMMTGHEVGAALGVATLTAVAGDLTSRTGLIEGVPAAFGAISGAMVLMAIFTALVVPGGKGAAGHGSHGGHGMH